MPSDSTNGTYDVCTLDDGDGVLYYSCTCKNWTVGKHQRGRTTKERIPCKHILRYKEDIEIQSPYVKAVQEPLKPVKGYSSPKPKREEPQVSQAEALLSAMKKRIH